MALIRTLSTAVLLTSLVLPLSIQRSYSSQINVSQAQVPISDADFVELILNLEYLVAEFFLFGVTGRGLDVVAPELTKGGPHPVGGSLATLDPFTRDVFRQFAFQKIGHLRAINREVKGFPRPLLNISKEIFAEIADRALEQTLNPPFNPYASSLNFLLASYVIADIAPPGYVGISPKLQNATSKRLVASLLGVESGQFSVIRAYLYEIKDLLVPPYKVTVTEFTNRISELGNRLGKAGTITEGLVVPKAEGAEGKVSGNVISGDKDSLAFAKEPSVVLRLVYGTGNESVPGTFFPSGANGRIARSYLSVTV